ncbi:hypothetical protein KPH14_009480 [Odynerus spinipes]|uniref:Uncharacterized protein n=1 Tax=Odynerus spinipes TaxID=1348599 RepID=A0AAD9RPH3_9HYME|nr:hypothetical protein KPH14_009480 [Odynerus spinipes]
MILHVLSLTIALLGCHAAPATYDQRQDGNLNVNADFQNFLFAFVTKGSLINDLASIDFKSMAKHIVSQGNKDDEPIMALEGEELVERSKTGKPYQVDIVRIPKDKEKSGDINGKELSQSLDDKLPKIAGESGQDLKKPESPSKDSGAPLNQEGKRTWTGYVSSVTTKSKLEEN